MTAAEDLRHENGIHVWVLGVDDTNQLLGRRAALPNWPRRMQAPLAAAYCGVSKTKFLRDVGEKYPRPEKDGRNCLWYREDLDNALDRLKGEGAPCDPLMEAINGRD